MGEIPWTIGEVFSFYLWTMGEIQVLAMDNGGKIRVLAWILGEMRIPEIVVQQHSFES